MDCVLYCTRVTHSLAAASGSVVHRSNSFEMFGVDVLLSEDFTPWIMEVNLSPALNHRTLYHRTLFRHMVRWL